MGDGNADPSCQRLLQQVACFEAARDALGNLEVIYAIIASMSQVALNPMEIFSRQ